jgi:site-specific DNA recombinase
VAIAAAPAATVAAIYVRVSSKEQVEGYSLDAQRRACRDFCAGRGYTVVADYADEGISPHTDNLAKRPAFSKLLADAETGRYGVIVAHMIDRFARKLRVAPECLEQPGRAHVGVVSVSEPDLNYSTPQGFLVPSMLGALAEWYSRNLATETRKGRAERKRRGPYAGRLPFGAMKGTHGVPCPDAQPIDANGAVTLNHAGLLLAFERAAEGATDAEVADALNARGYRPSAHARRARFTREAIRTILANRFYVGELPMCKRGSVGWLKDAHEPLIPVDRFDPVQRQRARRASNANASKVNQNARVYALSGLVRCAVCGESMHLEGALRLSCWGRRQAQGCRAPTVTSRRIEEELGRFLHGLRLPDATQVRILKAYREARPEASELDRQR